MDNPCVCDNSYVLRTCASCTVLLSVLYVSAAALVWFLWLHFMLPWFPTKHQHSDSTDHVVQGPKIPANRVFCSSSNSVRPANQKKARGYQAAPVTNACHMTVTPMETVTRNKICSWIWKGETFCIESVLVQKCLRLSSRNFSTREMRFRRRPRDLARRTQLSGSVWVCVCVCA